MSNDLFLLNKNLGRKKYIIYVSAFLLGFIILEAIGVFLTFKLEKTNYDLLIAASMSFQITLMVFINLMLFILSYKRFVDINLPGLFGILAAIIFIQIPVIITLMLVNKKRDKKSIKESNVEDLANDATITLYDQEEVAELVQSNSGK